VREFERKIAELELQLDMLRRQVVGGPKPAVQNQHLVLFNEKGQLVRIELPDLTKPGVVAQLDPRGLLMPRQFGMIVGNAYDELLLVLSSGRTVHLPAEQLPLSSGDRLAWDDTFAADLRALEELVSMVPITRMSLFDYAVQTSRFGYARKIAQSYFKTFIANNNIGRGIKFDFDRLCNLSLANEAGVVVLACRSGAIFATQAAALPVGLDEVIHFKVGDYLAASFAIDPEQLMVAVSEDSVGFVQKADWLILAKPGERKFRQVFPERKAGEMTLAGAAAANLQDWGLALREDGTIYAFRVSDLSTRGRPIQEGCELRILALAVLPAALEEG
jgi:DNA gyrase/topoisomerase IV subunit A